MIDFLRHLLGLPLNLLVWVGILLAANLLCGALNLESLEGQAVLAALAVAAILMLVLFAVSGFSRLLGAAHLPWLPLLIWVVFRLDGVPPGSSLRIWLMVVMTLNGISLVMDVIDVARWLRGERAAVVVLSTGA